LPPVLSPRPAEIGVYAPWHALLEEPIVDANNETLTGQLLQPWAPLDRLMPVTWDTYQTRTQFELTPTSTPVAVSVGGETISFVSVEPGTATRFVLIDNTTGTIYDGTTPIPVPRSDVYYEGTQLVVLAYDANDLLLVGQEPTVIAKNATIDVSVGGPAFLVWGKSIGSSSIVVTYDGLTTTFPTTTP